ncbi:MAG: diacylglycerol kinase family lipid kinase [Planctomycetaceae bacterium]|nr:diacylglycerol kinase family lipid kinase [Planctomycetaceae bacterium]
MSGAPRTDTTRVRRCVLIANPHGGLRRGSSVLEAACRRLEDAGVRVSVSLTQHRGHAHELAQTLDLTSCDALGIIGGDGTVHEVVNGLLTQTDEVTVPLALIPAGTGNTLHHEIGCHNAEIAVQFLLDGRTRCLDVATVVMQDRVVNCVNIIGFGVVTEINRTAEKLRWLGPLRYTLAAAVHLLAPRARRVRLTADSTTTECDVFFVMACNTQSTGAGMLLAPEASVSDGRFDLIVLKKTSRWELLQMFKRVFRGTHLSLPSVTCQKVRSFALAWDGTEALNLDGEMSSGTPFQTQVQSGVLRVFCDKDAS